MKKSINFAETQKRPGLPGSSAVMSGVDLTGSIIWVCEHTCSTLSVSLQDTQFLNSNAYTFFSSFSFNFLEIESLSSPSQFS